MKQRSPLHTFIIGIGVLPLLLWNCKEKPVPTAPIQKVETVKTNSKTIKELAKFAALNITDSTDITDLMLFKEIDESGTVIDSDAKKIEQLFKSLSSSTPLKNMAVVEIKNTDLAVLAVNGKGFSGTIWAKLLVNLSSGEIQKIEIDHLAESEGYGAGITRKSFEEQFVGVQIDPVGNSLSLMQGGQLIIEGKYKIDGLAGATNTSKGVVEMLNEGLLEYRNYLNH